MSNKRTSKAKRAKYTLTSFVPYVGRMHAHLMALALALAWYSDSNATVSVTMSELAKHLGRSNSSIRAQMLELEGCGWLRCVTRSLGRKPSTYCIVPLQQLQNLSAPRAYHGVHAAQSSAA